MKQIRIFIRILDTKYFKAVLYVEWIAIIIASLIPYGVTIWTYLYPKESLLLGKRGIYKEEPEITESAIKNTKMKAKITIIVYPIVYIIAFVYIYSL